MSYSAEMPAPPVTSQDIVFDPKGWSIYTVSVHINKDGHGCTYFNSITGDSRRMLAERQGCLQLEGQTRNQALIALHAVVTDMLSALRAETA